MKRFPLMIAALAVPILLAIAGSKNSQNTGALTPVLGNYPDTSLALSTDTTDTPDASPMNTERINVSTSTDFKGTRDRCASGGGVHGDGESLRQRRRERDQNVYADRNDASDLRASEVCHCRTYRWPWPSIGDGG